MCHPFDDIAEGQLETLNHLQAQYAADTSPQKVDLMCGVYRTDEGEPFVFPSVKEARRKMFSNPLWNHEYPPSHLGTAAYRMESSKLVFGDDDRLLSSNRIACAQVLGGSGANHFGALFLKLHYPAWKCSSREAYIPAESWANHPNVFSFLDIIPRPLPYYSPKTHALDFDAFHAAIDALPPSSVIVLQTCGQSPTGCDSTPAQWWSLAEMFAKKGHFAFFDAAYPGMVSGNFATDVECVRVFAKLDIPLLVAMTFGKAFGLYGERVGVLMITTPDRNVTARVERQMKLLARAETGAMPAFGAMVVETILSDEKLKRMWEADVKGIAEKLKERRLTLRTALADLRTPGDWDFLLEQWGMFSYTGFTAKQIDMLRESYHVYLQDNGRLSIASLSIPSIQYVADSIDKVVRESETSHS